MYYFLYQVQPNIDIPDETRSPQETILHIEKKDQSASDEGKDSDMQIYFPPVVANSGIEGADGHLDTLRRRHVPDTAHTDESPVHTTASSERTSETFTTASLPAAVFQTSPDPNIHPPDTGVQTLAAASESFETKNGTEKRPAFLGPLVQEDEVEELRVPSPVRHYNVVQDEEEERLRLHSQVRICQQEM